MSALQVEIFDSFQDAEPTWRHYQDRYDHYVYQTCDWVTCWYEHVGCHRNIALCLVDVRDADDTPLAFLPFGVEKRRLGSALIWLGGDIADYHGPLLAQQGADRLNAKALDHLWASLRRKLPALDYADFSRQPLLIGAMINPFATVGRLAEAKLALSARLVGDWQQYYGAKRGKKTRHNDRRKRRKLESMGKLSFVIATTPEEIDAQVTVMLEQKDLYVTRLGQINILRQHGQADFLKQLTTRKTAHQMTVLCALKLDDDILAVQWGIVHRRRLYSVIASYDDGPLSRFSTGDILLRELLVWCFDNDVDVVDFTCGDEPYKLAWCDQSLDLQDRLLPLTPLGHATVSARLCMAKIRQWARSSPALRSAVTGWRSRALGHTQASPSASSEMPARQTGSNTA